MVLEKSGGIQKTWQVATAMLTEKTDGQGFGSYRSNNYAELIDHPVEIGELSIAEFKACGTPHRIVISGRQQANLKRITQDLKTLCTYHIQFFGEPAPFDRYDFMLYAAGDDQYGGLEHSFSTSLICPRNWLPVKGESLNEEGYRDFLKLCSHEYFHAWHVKRIQPLTFQDADLSKEAYTRLLWVFEGFTAYYDALAVQRCGLMSRENYLQHLAQTITRLLHTPGRMMQSLEDSSFDTWTKLYRPDENTPNAQISYYLKGSLAAMAIDLTLRAETKTSLDDVTKHLWQAYGKSGLGVAEDAIEELLLERAGRKHARFFKALMRDTTDLPFAKLFKPFAIDYKIKPALADRNKPNDPSSVLGIKLAAGIEAKLAYVYNGGATEIAGLAGGDVVIAIDGIKVNAQNIERLVSRKAHGSRLQVHAFRRDELMVFTVVTQAEDSGNCHLTLRTKPDKRSKQLLDAWLR
jgi:predicted metalloprotease with PDZ domain